MSRLPRTPIQRPRRTPVVYGPTPEEERGVSAHSMRVHHVQPGILTGLLDEKCRQAFAWLETFESPSQSTGRRLTMRHDQTCRALGIGWRQGIAGMLVEITDDEELCLWPNLIPTPKVLSLFQRKVSQRIAGCATLKMTGEVRGWEVFSVMTEEDAHREKNLIACHWDDAPEEYRPHPYNDLFAFKVPAFRLSDGSMIEPALRGYAPASSVGIVKTEMYWHHHAGERRDLRLVHQALVRQLRRLIAIIRPHPINLNKLAERTGQFHGLALPVRKGQWQRSIQLHLQQTGPHLESDIAAWMHRESRIAPERRKIFRTLQRLADQGRIACVVGGPERVYGPVVTL